MTFLLVLAVLALAGIVGSLRCLFYDGPACPPRSHRVDPDFVAPAARPTYGSFDRAA